MLSSPSFAGASFQLPTKDAIADLGATQIFVMEEMPVLNKSQHAHYMYLLQMEDRLCLHTCVMLKLTVYHLY
jgi:hypothetical protein